MGSRFLSEGSYLQPNVTASLLLSAALPRPACKRCPQGSGRQYDRCRLSAHVKNGISWWNNAWDCSFRNGFIVPWVDPLASVVGKIIKVSYF